MVWLILLWVLLGCLAVVLAYILLLIISAALVDMKREYEQESRFYRFLMEKLPKGRFLMVSNHRSKFDPILSWLVFGDCQIAFISKPENFKVPVFGRLIHRLCFMPIDRDNPRNAVKTINRAVDLLKRDVATVAVYPEGTRNYGEGLLPLQTKTAVLGDKVRDIMLKNLRGEAK